MAATADGAAAVDAGDVDAVAGADRVEEVVVRVDQHRLRRLARGDGLGGLLELDQLLVRVTQGFQLRHLCSKLCRLSRWPKIERADMLQVCLGRTSDMLQVLYRAIGHMIVGWVAHWLTSS